MKSSLLVVLVITMLSITSCSLFQMPEPEPQMPNPTMEQLEKNILQAAQDRAIRKILGLDKIPAGSYTYPSK